MAAGPGDAPVRRPERRGALAMSVDVLVVGGGGREHALISGLKRSASIGRLFCAPGNAGIARDATLIPIAAEDIPALADFAERESIGLTVVGPEAPLVA